MTDSIEVWSVECETSAKMEARMYYKRYITQDVDVCLYVVVLRQYRGPHCLLIQWYAFLKDIPFIEDILSRTKTRQSFAEISILSPCTKT